MGSVEKVTGLDARSPKVQAASFVTNSFAVNISLMTNDRVSACFSSIPGASAVVAVAATAKLKHWSILSKISFLFIL